MVKKISTYYREVMIPVRVLKNKVMQARDLQMAKFNKLPKPTRMAAAIFGIIGAFLAQAFVFSAFEAHIINVTAHVCNYSETRTIGYWKNHPEVYDPALLTQFVGTDSSCSWYRFVDSQTVVDEVLDTSEPKGKKGEPKDMHIQLRAQLLGMKFNIANFGIGGYVANTCDYNGTNLGIYSALDDLVSKADDLLCKSDSTKEELEEMKNKLDCLNNLHQIRACPAADTLLMRFSLPQTIIDETITTQEGIDVELPLTGSETVPVETLMTEDPCTANPETCPSTDSGQVPSTDSEQISSTDSEQATSTSSEQTPSTDSGQTTFMGSEQTAEDPCITQPETCPSTDSGQVPSTDSEQTSSTSSGQAPSTEETPVEENQIVPETLPTEQPAENPAL